MPATPFLHALLSRCAFPTGDGPLVCAVSGGPDSMALLALACATGRAVTAVHVDHGLRTGSDSEADLVAAAAERFGADFTAKRVSVAPGPNLEARARSARYAVLPGDALIGHTADDQAETVLLHLLRGAGLAGMGAMLGDRRPMLGLRRAETNQLCDELGLAVVKDASNDDPRFRRNRVRAELIPLMNDIGERDVVPLLASNTFHFQRAERYLTEAAEQLDATDAKLLAAAPEELAMRAIRQWLRRVIDDEQHPPDTATVLRVLAVARGEALACDAVGGWRVIRSQQRLQLVNKASTAN